MMGSPAADGQKRSNLRPETEIDAKRETLTVAALLFSPLLIPNDLPTTPIPDPHPRARHATTTSFFLPSFFHYCLSWFYPILSYSQLPLHYPPQGSASLILIVLGSSTSHALKSKAVNPTADSSTRERVSPYSE